MTTEPQLAPPTGYRKFLATVDRYATERPDLPYMIPFMAFLLLLPLNDLLPYHLRPIAIALRGAIPMYAFWIFRKHYPPLGKPHWVLSIVVGVLVALGWVYGQHFLNGIHAGDHSLGGRFFLFPGQPHADDPRVTPYAISQVSWWSQAVLRILVSCTTVGVVEEIFWRAFLLRALIDWDRFYRIPLGTFTWVSFLGTTLLSMLEHPDNWGVSLGCWVVYNGLMYWKKSVLCLILTHNITNLVLYAWVVWGGMTQPDAAWYWLFW